MLNSLRYSIGVPVYNQAKTIRATVQSILEQNGYFDEIVISDNHSTDGTSEIIREYSPRIRIVTPPRHLGMAENWNFCVSQMSCDWFSLLSGDDYLYPDFAKQMRTSILRNPDAVLVRGGVDIVDGNRQIVHTNKLRSVARNVPYPRNAVQQLTGSRVNFACFAVARNAWLEVGGFPEQFNLAQDWGFWLRLAPHGNFIKAEGGPLVQYTSTFRPEVDAKRVPLFFQDACQIYQWIRKSGVIELSDRNVCRLYRLRFLDFLEYFRGSSENAQGLAKPFVEELGRRGGYSAEQVRQRLEHGAAAYDKGWQKAGHILVLLRDVWWRFF